MKQLFNVPNSKIFLSKAGEVFELKQDRFQPKKITTRKDGYLCLSLRGKSQCVHQLMREVFMDNQDSNLQINHINGNKSDNHLANLELVTPKENIAKAKNHNLNFQKQKIVARRKSELLFFESIGEAARFLNIRGNGITQACQKIIRTYKGYEFFYMFDFLKYIFIPEQTIDKPAEITDEVEKMLKEKNYPFKF